MDDKVKVLVEKAKITAGIAADAGKKYANVAGKKASSLMEIPKLNMKVFDLNTDIEMLYKEIGKCVYLTHTGAEVSAEEISAKVASIDEKQAQIAAIKEEIAAKKSTKACQVCGKPCDKDDAYCSVCGAEL